MDRPGDYSAIGDASFFPATAGGCISHFLSPVRLHGDRRIDPLRARSRLAVGILPGRGVLENVWPTNAGCPGVRQKQCNRTHVDTDS